MVINDCDLVNIKAKNKSLTSHHADLQAKVEFRSLLSREVRIQLQVLHKQHDTLRPQSQIKSGYQVESGSIKEVGK